MHPTPYPQVNALIGTILSRIQDILGEKLVGLYLYGSLVTGDFDEEISDVDLTAALAADVDDAEFESLRRMHCDLAASHGAWDGRIEVCYIALDALNTVRTRQSPIVNISPGEPFHRMRSRKEWLLNWYLLREEGLTLYGPPPRTIIEPIFPEEFIQSIKDHARAWRDWVQDAHTRGSQAYAILSLCRCLYACRHGTQTSKRQAATWAAHQVPEWSALFADALAWRRAQWTGEQDGTATHAETTRCVHSLVERVLAT